jgi:hypothetical protein
MPFDTKIQKKSLTFFIEFAFSLQVFEHKEARSGKVCPIQLSAPLLQELKDYRNMLGEYSVPYLFQFHTYVEHDWERFWSNLIFILRDENPFMLEMRDTCM